VEHGEVALRSLVDFVPEPEPSSLAQRLQQALVRRLREQIGADRYNSFGQLADWRSGLVPGIEPELLESRVFDLRARLVRPDSAAALTLNSFLPWLRQMDRLRLAGIEGFKELHFDARCPTGVRGTPPHIELMASGASGVVGASIRTFDYLGRRQSRLSSAYTALVVSEALEPWVELMRAFADRTERFQYVDVPALAKLAIGMGRIFVRRPTRLLYVFLEPAGAAGVLPFAEHRRELARLAALTAGSAVRLVACSFHELWEGWRREEAPPRLREIVAELERRYGVAMPR
jgi:hypothetical protein